MEIKKKKQNMVFVVDDERDILELIEVNLIKNNYIAETFLSADVFFDRIKIKKPDLIILDLMLPDIDGLEICKLLKKDKDLETIPIIMLTAKTDESDVILGLELGADDYMLKPFSVKELISRIKAILRRSNIRTETILDISKNDTIEIDNLIKIDLNLHSVFVSDKEIELTKTEFDILTILCQKRGWVFSREVLLDKLWGSDKFVIDRTIDVHIKHLRDKLGTAGTLIKNVRGVGYKI